MRTRRERVPGLRAPQATERDGVWRVAVPSALIAAFGFGGVAAGDLVDGDDIQEAIDAASAGDVIAIPAGVFPVDTPIDLRGKEITLRGAVGKGGLPATILDGGDSSRVMQCVSGESSQTRIQNLAIVNGQATEGAGLRIVASSPRVEGCLFEANVSETAGCFPCPPGQGSTPADGGAVWIDQGLPGFVDCVFQGNVAAEGAAIWARDAALALRNCTFQDHVAGGGAIWADSSVLDLDDVEFLNNRNLVGDPVFSGGAIRLENGSLDLKGGLFVLNEARFGGALYFANLDDQPTQLRIEDVRFESNAAVDAGGAVTVEYVGAGTVPVELVDIGCHLNASGGNGGGFNFTGGGFLDLSFEGCNITDNFAENLGGGVFIKNLGTEPVAYVDCRIKANAAPRGSGIFDTRCPAFDGVVVCGNEIEPQIDAGDGCTVPESGGCLVTECCEGDLDCNGVVDGADLARLLGDWGLCNGCIGDLAGAGDDQKVANGRVDGQDLTIILGGWGLCD